MASQFVEIEINFLLCSMLSSLLVVFVRNLFVLNDGIGYACVRCLPINRRKSTNHVRLISCKCISWFVPFHSKDFTRTMHAKHTLFFKFDGDFIIYVEMVRIERKRLKCNCITKWFFRNNRTKQETTKHQSNLMISITFLVGRPITKD